MRELPWALLSKRGHLFAAIASMLFVGTFSTAGDLFARSAPNPGIAVATAAAVAPLIDGSLDDAAWQQARWVDAFVQKSPVNGALPSRKTAFAVLYDDTALYVAVRCFVDQQQEIVTRMVRRDREAELDYVEITLSPREDGRTAYGFLVNPSGVLRDRYWSDDQVFDAGWDAVWQAETAISAIEWTVEVAIPLDQLRFSNGRPSFGLQVARWMASRKELDLFNPVADDRIGSVSTMGKLVGVDEITGNKPLTIIPESYLSFSDTTNGYDTRRRDGLELGGGGYAKVGVTPDMMLDLAVLPDFGQVEVDDLVVNLSTYETQFPEKRSFFLESTGLFTTPVALFYSRRVGQPPPEPALADNERVIHGDTRTPILSAAGLTGRTETGVLLGVLEAVYLPTELVIENEETGLRTRRTGTPWTHVAALRTVSEIGTNSTMGALVTALNPSESEGAYSGGVDWNALTPDREYAFRGQVAGTMRFDQVRGQDESYGTALWTQLAREGGEPFRYRVAYQRLSKGFDPNDLGYIKRNDLHYYIAELHHAYRESVGPFDQIYSGIGADGNFNLEGLMLAQSGWFYQSLKWHSHWTSDMSVWGGPPHFDDRETRGGPPLKRPVFGGGNFTCETPKEKPMGFRLGGTLSARSDGYATGLSTALLVRLGRVELELAPGIARTVGELAYADTLNDGEPNEISVVGQRDLTELKVAFKGTVVFTRNLTLQLHSQLLTIGANYRHYQRVYADGSTSPIRYQDDAGTPLEADFARVDLVLQPLLRWEYLPGSTLFLIYTHRGFVNIEESRAGAVDAVANLENEEREQLIMIKWSHRFGQRM